MVIYVVSSLCLCFFFILINFFNKLWYSPIRTQKLMASQGIRGPSYRFLFGNTTEMIKMRQEGTANPMELSHNMFQRILPHSYLWSKLYGVNYLNWMGPQAEVVVSDPELIKVVLNNGDGAYLKPDPIEGVRKLLGDGLTTSEGAKWLKCRKLANHAFHAKSLKSMTPVMISSVEMMLEKWRNRVDNHKEIEVFQEFKFLTSDVISKTAFGSSYLEGEKIFHMLTKLTICVSRGFLRIRIPVINKIFKTKDDVESEKLEQGIRDSIIKMVRTREEMVPGGGSGNFGNDFLGSLVSAYHSDDHGKKITMEDVIDECKTFYIAGQETTAVALSWIVLLLAIHTDWQDKARAEVLGSFGQDNPTSDGIARLTTMGMIIHESLRLYSPVAHITRKSGWQTRLRDLIVPANTLFNISPLALHHNPEIWGEDAHTFKPERFAQGVAKATGNNPTAYIPFGFGPRTCVGQNFAINEIKIALSMILQRYRFTLSPNYVHCPTMLLAVYPKHGVHIILHQL